MQTIIKVLFCGNCARVDFKTGQGFIANTCLTRTRVKKIQDGKVLNNTIIAVLCPTCERRMMR